MMITEEQYKNILRYAVKAPSQLNTQAWRFEVEDGLISLFPDFSRALPVSDPHRMNLYVSMGAVVENLLLASEHYGIEAIPEIIPVPGYNMVRVRLTKSEHVISSKLFHQINLRQVVSEKYYKDELDELLIESFVADSEQEGIAIYPILRQDYYGRLIALVKKGIQMRCNGHDYVKEVIRWVRLSEKEALLKGDGVRAVSLGLPFSAMIFGRIFIRQFLCSKCELKRWTSLLNHTPGFVVFAVKDNTPREWIRTGISLQRFVLHLSRAGICYSHLPLPFEYPLLRKELSEYCGINGNIPIQIIRIGKAAPVAYTFRRKLKHNVLMNI